MRLQWLYFLPYISTFLFPPIQWLWMLIFIVRHVLLIQKFLDDIQWLYCIIYIHRIFILTSLFSSIWSSKTWNNRPPFFILCSRFPELYLISCYLINIISYTKKFSFFCSIRLLSATIRLFAMKSIISYIYSNVLSNSK